MGQANRRSIVTIHHPLKGIAGDILTPHGTEQCLSRPSCKKTLAVGHQLRFSRRMSHERLLGGLPSNGHTGKHHHQPLDASMTSTGGIRDVGVDLEELLMPFGFQLVSFAPRVDAGRIVHSPRVPVHILQQEMADLHSLQRISCHQATHGSDPLAKIWSCAG